MKYIIISDGKENQGYDLRGTNYKKINWIDNWKDKEHDTRVIIDVVKDIWSFGLVVRTDRLIHIENKITGKTAKIKGTKDPIELLQVRNILLEITER